MKSSQVWGLWFLLLPTPTRMPTSLRLEKLGCGCATPDPQSSRDGVVCGAGLWGKQAPAVSNRAFLLLRSLKEKGKVGEVRGDLGSADYQADSQGLFR